MKHVVARTLAMALTFSMFALACERSSSNQTTAAPDAATSNGDRCPHDIRKDKCPFCTPSLIASDGFCGGHGVAEALCYQCRPYLKTAFRAKGDWCKEHDAPESQCLVCHPELKENIKPGAGHGIGTS